MFALLWYTHADDLSNITLNYCDTPENTVQYTLFPGAITGICYTFSNSANTPVTIKVLFVDGTFTNDQQQNKACLGDTERDNFWQYVTGYDQVVTVNPGETIKKEAQIFYPVGMDGVYHGCIVYSLIETGKDIQVDATPFSILMRKAKFIDIIVGNPAAARDKGIILEEFTHGEWENLSHNKKVRIYKDSADDKYIIQLKVHNLSSIEQNIIITWVTSNILTYKNTFVETRKIGRGETLVITKKLPTIPTYNLKVDLSIANVPSSLDDQAVATWMTQEKTMIWIRNIMSYLSFVWLLFLAGIISLLIQNIKKSKEKKPLIHYVHHHIKHKKRKKN